MWFKPKHLTSIFILPPTTILLLRNIQFIEVDVEYVLTSVVNEHMLDQVAWLLDTTWRLKGLKWLDDLVTRTRIDLATGVT